MWVGLRDTVVPRRGQYGPQGSGNATIGDFTMKRVLFCAAAALVLSMPAAAGSGTIADRCMARVSKGAITTFRDVDVLASGRDRIAYFRCVRSGMRDDADVSAFSGLVPSINSGFGGAGSGFGSFNINL